MTIQTSQAMALTATARAKAPAERVACPAKCGEDLYFGVDDIGRTVARCPKCQGTSARRANPMHTTPAAETRSRADAIKIATLEIELVHARRALGAEVAKVEAFAEANRQLRDERIATDNLHAEQLAAARRQLALVATPDSEVADLVRFFTEKRRQGRPTVEATALRRRVEAILERINGPQDGAV